MTDDFEPDSDPQNHDTEEERRRHRSDKQDQEDKTQPSPLAQSGGEPSGKGEVESGEPEPDYTPSELIVPDLALEDVMGPESIDPITTVPAIEQASRDLKVPELSLQDIAIETTPVNVVTEIPDIAVEKKDCQIPLVQLGSAPTVKFHPLSFDTEIRKPLSRRREQFSVPLYRRMPTPRVRFVLPTLDEELDEEIRRRLNQLKSDDAGEDKIQGPRSQEDEVEKVEDVDVGGAETSTAESVAGTGGGGHTGGAAEKIPTFQEIIFNGGGGTTATEGTIIVLFNEAKDNSYVGSYLTLCRRIYREANGGHPDFQPINHLNEVNKREIEKWLDADKKVIFINLDDGERQINKVKLREKLEATLGKFGFVVFKATDPGLVTKYRKALNDIRAESPHLPLNVVEVTPRQLRFDSERRMAELCWGNLNIEEADVRVKETDFERPTGPGVFDDLFNHYASTEFEGYLNDIKSEERELFKRVTTENRGQIQDKERDDYGSGESPLHYDIKVYVVRYLVKRLRDRGEDVDGLQDIDELIKTETKHEGVIPDVLFTEPKEAYEIETLFGSGHEPTKKIDNTIKKYEENDVSVDKIHIVFENFTFLRHLDELNNIQYHYAPHKNEEGEPLISFETLNLQNGGLLSLDTVIEEVRGLTGEQ